MPQAKGAENYVAGSILLCGINALEQVTDVLSDAMFYQEANAILYRAFLEMQSNGIPIDAYTACKHLEKTGNLTEVGGPLYITELMENVASDAHVAHHAGIIRNEYLRRKMIEAAYRAYNRGFDEGEEISASVSLLDSDIRDIQELMAGRRDTSHIRDIVKEAISNAYKRAEDKRKGIGAGITTGFADLNRKLAGGWKAPELVILAARPSVGKTALALHMAERAARNGVPVLFVSLEMDKTQLADRMIIGRSGVDSYGYKSGHARDEELAMAEKVSFSELAGLPLHIEDNPHQTVLSIFSRARVMKRKGKCGLLIIDYLQLITPVSGQNREQEVSQISRSLKLGAKELGIPVIALSQQNRKGGADLSTLRDSGAIEQDADVVIFIERNGEDGDVEMVDEGNKLIGNLMHLNIKKNRHGETGIVHITHNSSFTAFYDCDCMRPQKTVAEYNPDKFHASGSYETPF
jgi:replicative DNA helicase